MVQGIQKQPKKKIFCLLGDVEIELINAPKSFAFKESNNYTEHDRIEGKPTLQWVGEDLDTLDLAFRFHANWCDPDAQLQQLRRLKDGRSPFPLTLGTGTFSGYWVIDDLSVNMPLTDERGNTIQLDVTVKLTEAERSKASPAKKLAPFRKRFRA